MKKRIPRCHVVQLGEFLSEVLDTNKSDRVEEALVDLHYYLSLKGQLVTAVKIVHAGILCSGHEFR